MGALTQGIYGGIALGQNIGSYGRRRKLEREMDEERKRRREMEDELRQERLQRTIEQRAEMEAGETGSLAEIETALQQMNAKPEGDWTPEDAAMAAALRRRRAGMQVPEAERLRAQQEREQAQIERSAEMGAAEVGSLAEIEAALQQMNAKPEGDWTPEDAAMAAALRRRRAAASTGGAGGMAKVREIDPEGRELEYQRPLAAIMAERQQQGGEDGQTPVTTRPAQGGQAAAEQLQPGAVVQQGGRRYRFRGGNPQDPANYEPVP